MLTVDVFDEDTATTYLIDRANRPDDGFAARQLARGLGCLPLALSHAAAYCESGTSFADYLDLLGELPAHELFDSHPELSYAQTVASTWKASIQLASRDAPLAATVLEMAAHMGPDAIPKSLFMTIIDADTARQRKRLTDALNALARFSLATVDDTTVSVHRLLQKVVRDTLRERRERTAARHALEAVDEAFPDDTTTPTGWPACEQLLPHALALADTLAPDGDIGPRLFALLNRASDYLFYSRGGRGALRTCQRIATDAERILGPEHPHTLEARNNLANAYTDAERTPEAITLHETLLSDRERILGPEQPETLSTRNNLADAYLAAGQTNDAIAIYETLLVDRERILGPEHPHTLVTRGGLTRAYRAAGQTHKAIAAGETLLSDRERILGPEHPSTLITHDDLAGAYMAADRTQEAIALYELLLTHREQILGPEHPKTVRTRQNLADGYRAVGRTTEAIAIHAALPRPWSASLAPSTPKRPPSTTTAPAPTPMAGAPHRR